MSAVLVLDRVTKRHGNGRTVVDALVNVSLSVQPGELVAVMGPSGSGKSTLLSLSGGLDTPSEGRVTIGDIDLASQSVSQLAGMRRRSIGFVFQDFNLARTITLGSAVGTMAERGRRSCGLTASGQRSATAGRCLDPRR